MPTKPEKKQSAARNAIKGLAIAAGGGLGVNTLAVLPTKILKTDINKQEFKDIIVNYRKKYRTTFGAKDLGDVNFSRILKTHYLPRPAENGMFRRLYNFVNKGAPDLEKQFMDDLYERSKDDINMSEKAFKKSMRKGSMGIVSSVRNEAYLRHELGHLREEKILNSMPVPVRGAYKTLLRSPQLAVLAMSSQTVRDKIRKVPGGNSVANVVEKHPIIASTVGLFFPNLYGEAFASIHAAKDLIKNRGLLKGIGRASNLIAPFASYLGYGAMVSSPLTAKIMYDRIKRRNEVT